MTLPTLNFYPEWAYAVKFLGKSVENRTKPTKYRGWIWLAATGKKPDFSEVKKHCDKVGVNCENLKINFSLPEAFPISQLFGIAKLTEIKKNSKSSIWAIPSFSYQYFLEDFYFFEQPIFFKCRQGLMYKSVIGVSRFKDIVLHMKNNR